MVNNVAERVHRNNSRNKQIGTDIIEIERVRKSAQSASFLNGVYTCAEREYYMAHGKIEETLAGMFCAKEAVANRRKFISLYFGESGVC